MDDVRFYTKEEMQPAVDFLKKGLKSIPEEGYRKNIEKIVKNFKVALAAAADNAEKHAYLFALYVNNAGAMASYLFLNNLLTPELEGDFRMLPTVKESDAAIEPYKKAAEARREEINKMQQNFLEHNKGLEVFKGVALGDSLEDAKAGVEAYEKKVAEQLARG